MFSKQLSAKLKEESEKDRDPQLSINANKYDRIMRSLSVKRDNNATKKVNIDIIQNFDETKLYIPPSPCSDSMQAPPSPKVGGGGAAATEHVEVNINQLLVEIVDCLKDNCSNWFNNTNLLRTLIPQALNYVDYNLKRNNNYIFEFEALLQAAQKQQENDLLKASQQEQQQQQQQQQPPPSPAESSKESKKRSKSLKILKSAEKRDKSSTPSLKPGDALVNGNGSSEPNLNSSAQANSVLNLNAATAELARLQLSGSLTSYLTDLRQQQAVQLNYRQLEQNITQIGYCLNTLNRFWSKFVSSTPDQAVFDEYLSLFYINNSDNLSAFSQLDSFLYNINWQVINKNVNDNSNSNSSDLDTTATDLHTILLTPSTSTNLINMNFLLNYYRLINYDFISFKLFIRQLQLAQIAAILCQIIYRILNFYHRTTSKSSAVNSRDNFVFPSSQYRPISWSNTHVTLHNIVSSSSQATTPNRPISPAATHHDSTAATAMPTLNSLFITDLKDFLNLSINRLNTQADVVNNTGYFYITNKSTGLVLEAFEQQQGAASAQPSNTRASVNAKTSTAKAARFYLTPKVKGRNEQLWYYYAYNGCIANKQVRSGFCMAVSSLNAKSPVCLFPNVRTTNCKWFFNHVDNSIISGLGENLVLDFDDESNATSQSLTVPAAATAVTSSNNNENKRFAVVINKKEVNKASQKWSIEFQ